MTGRLILPPVAQQAMIQEAWDSVQNSQEAVAEAEPWTLQPVEDAQPPFE